MWAVQSIPRVLVAGLPGLLGLLPLLQLLALVLVLLVLTIVVCAVYQSRASIMQRADRWVATSNLSRRIRSQWFKWRPNAASEAELDVFDEGGPHSGTRMPRIHPVGDAL